MREFYGSRVLDFEDRLLPPAMTYMDLMREEMRNGTVAMERAKRARELRNHPAARAARRMMSVG